MNRLGPSLQLLKGNTRRFAVFDFSREVAFPQQAGHTRRRSGPLFRSAKAWSCFLNAVCLLGFCLMVLFYFYELISPGCGPLTGTGLTGLKFNTTVTVHQCSNPCFKLFDGRECKVLINYYFKCFLVSHKTSSVILKRRFFILWIGFSSLNDVKWSYINNWPAYWSIPLHEVGIVLYCTDVSLINCSCSCSFP